jgi:hypothetical protein
MDEWLIISHTDNGAGTPDIHTPCGFKSFAVPCYMEGIRRSGRRHVSEWLATTALEGYEATDTAGSGEAFGDRLIDRISRLEDETKRNR